MKIIQTAERTSELKPSDNVIYHRHLIAYEEAAKSVKGKVLEIGSGQGYGIKILAPNSDKYVAVDKYKTNIDNQLKSNNNIEFHQIKVPPLAHIPDNYFDYVVSFQVIEHIKKDDFFVKEAYRVLKSEGKLILTTPNIKMSLTRNPWHIREYTKEQLQKLIENYFSKIVLNGIFGNEKIMKYYNKNKKSVKKITRFDIFNLQYHLPGKLLQIPYDIMNRINRNLLLKSNSDIIKNISANDFYLNEATDECFDFFCIATKIA
jgi:2-polyprenyl-3-methyl-5-hydroxy-6-metoxy-1,4-benzoquinol methylase